MSYKTRLQNFDRDVVVKMVDSLSAAAQSKYFAQFARKALREGQAQNRRALGRVPPHKTWVNGAPSENLDAAGPNGRIVFEFELFEEALEYIGRLLVMHSPVLTGRFRQSFVVMADNKMLEPGDPVPLNVEEIAFVNTQPYARKIERGQSAQAPKGVMETVAKMARDRFANMAEIRFGYRTPLLGAINVWANQTRMDAKGRTGRNRNEWLRRQPAIIVRPR